MSWDRCKTCTHWQTPKNGDGYHGSQICSPLDPDTMKPMKRGFESRLCKHPSQALFEAPVQADSFALTDASNYMACLATGEDFGCVLHTKANDGKDSGMNSGDLIAAAERERLHAGAA